MKQLIISLVVGLSFSLGYSQTAQIVGGKISYEAQGNNRYKIIANVNRRCSGEPLAMPILKVFAANHNFNLTLTRTNIADITTFCKSVIKPCNPPNTTTSEGIEQHTFEANIDFNSLTYSLFKTNGNCHVYFGLTGAKRSDSINTLISKNDFYVEAMINLCALGNGANTSSNFRSPAFLAANLNLPFVYNISVSDLVDFDSIAYMLIPAQNSHNQSETYVNNLSYRIPLTPFCPPNTGQVDCRPIQNAKPPRGFYFDSMSGDFILTPTKKEVGVFVVKCLEFRKINNVTTLIGYTTNEVCVQISDLGSNNPPIIMGINYFSICEGEKLCFRISTSDDPFLPKQTTLDTITLTWNMGIPGATFTIINPNEREKIGEFCWQSKEGDANNNWYNFLVTAKDDYCPQPGRSVKNYSIKVNPKAKASSSYIKKDKTLFFENIASYSGVQTFNWSIRDSTNNGTVLKSSSMKKDSFTFANYGKYYITRIVNNPPLNCPTTYFDSIIVDVRNTSINNEFTIKLGKINVYPNPAKKIITIQTNANETYLKLIIYNSIGKEVYNGEMQQTIDISEFAKGIYTLLVKSEKGHYTAQIIKE